MGEDILQLGSWIPKRNLIRGLRDVQPSRLSFHSASFDEDQLSPGLVQIGKQEDLNKRKDSWILFVQRSHNGFDDRWGKKV